MSKKLDEIKKENVFKVPDDYFADLPQIIQARVHQKSRAHVEIFAMRALRLAVPVILILMVSVIYFMNDPEAKPESLLAQVDARDIVYYLENHTDISTDDIIESIAQEGTSLDFSDPTLDEIDESSIDEEILEYYNLDQDSWIN